MAREKMSAAPVSWSLMTWARTQRDRGQRMSALFPPWTEMGLALTGIISSCGYGICWAWRAPSGHAKLGLDAPWHVQLRVSPSR
jgi:hypothetical protein